MIALSGCMGEATAGSKRKRQLFKETSGRLVSHLPVQTMAKNACASAVVVMLAPRMQRTALPVWLEGVKDSRHCGQCLQ